jgi:hypothetical protein
MAFEPMLFVDDVVARAPDGCAIALYQRGQA